METVELTTDRSTIEAIVRRYEPNIEEITYIDHGRDNLVVCVNQKLVFRFPRNDLAARRLQFSVALLQYIKGKVTVVPSPAVLEIASHPVYAVTAYSEGGHLTPAQITALPDDEQAAAGRSLGEFIVEFTEAISAIQLAALREQAGLVGAEEPWAEYFERLFVRQALPNNKLAPVVDEYYAIWKNYNSSELKAFSIHDDLHSANILFSGPRISAILDYGDANVGSAEEEMRGLYRMGDKVLAAAIGRYQELTGRVLSYDHIRVWAVVTDLARFVRYLGEDQTTNPAFLRAQANLREWLPGFPL